MFWDPERHQRQIFPVRIQAREQAWISMHLQHDAARHYKHAPADQNGQPRIWTVTILVILLLVIAFGTVALA